MDTGFSTYLDTTMVANVIAYSIYSACIACVMFEKHRSYVLVAFKQATRLHECVQVLGPGVFAFGCCFSRFPGPTHDAELLV